MARLLAAAPDATLTEAARLAASGKSQYVRAKGRVSSTEEFPDEHQRPLVFRRRRIERKAPGSGWQLIEDDREAVPFGIEDRTTFVAVDVDALGEGLVVIPREASGTYGELPADVRARDTGETPDAEAPAPETAVRMRLDQVSAVEHATVCGVPVQGAAGPMLSAGLGRPLVLSTLEPAAAMRVLAGDDRRTVQAAAVAMVGGLGLGAVALVAFLIGS